MSTDETRPSLKDDFGKNISCQGKCHVWKTAKWLFYINGKEYKTCLDCYESKVKGYYPNVAIAEERVWGLYFTPTNTAKRDCAIYWMTVKELGRLCADMRDLKVPTDSGFKSSVGVTFYDQRFHQLWEKGMKFYEILNETASASASSATSPTSSPTTSTPTSLSDLIFAFFRYLFEKMKHFRCLFGLHWKHPDCIEETMLVTWTGCSSWTTNPLQKTQIQNVCHDVSIRETKWKPALEQWLTYCRFPSVLIPLVYDYLFYKFWNLDEAQAEIHDLQNQLKMLKSIYDQKTLAIFSHTRQLSQDRGFTFLCDVVQAQTRSQTQSQNKHTKRKHDDKNEKNERKKAKIDRMR